MWTQSLIAAFVLSSNPVAPAPAGNQLAPDMEVAVPFGCGLKFPVSQAHDVGSHRNNDVYAWDFRMPEGTPISAARDGQVRMARGDSTEGACSESAAGKSNYIVIAHGKGYETQYLHLSRVIVKPGQKVRAGELLGYSGKTGWSCGPHLHFKVTFGGAGGWNNPSVPATIKGYGDPQAHVLVAAPACPSTGPEIYQASKSKMTDGRPQLATVEDDAKPAAEAPTSQGGSSTDPAAVEAEAVQIAADPQGG